MVFIRKKLQEDNMNIGMDWDNTLPAEVVDAGIEALSNQGDTNNTTNTTNTTTATTEEVVTEEEKSSERFYDWHDILEVLSDYLHPDIIRQIEDDWMFNYPDNFMDQASVDDLINDINSQYNEELASEIRSRIDQLQDPKAVATLDLSTDIGVLQDALDKISDVNIKEKLINLIDSLK